MQHFKCIRSRGAANNVMLFEDFGAYRVTRWAPVWERPDFRQWVYSGPFAKLRAYLRFWLGC